MRNGRHRLFFALAPGEALRAQLAQCAQSLSTLLRVKGRAMPPAQLHLTLAFLGESSGEHALASALAAGAATRGNGFALLLDHASSFGPTWYLGADSTPTALSKLHTSLNAQLVQEGFALERRALHPHVTFLRQAARPLSRVPIAPIAWEAEDFVLFDSRPAERRYLELGRWPLA